MLFQRKDNPEHYGSNSYVFVERLIKSSKDIRIISPYIDSYYANFIVRNAKGKNIRIISSAISKDAKKKLSKMSFGKFLAFGFLLVLFNYLAEYFAKPLQFGVALATLFAFFAYLLVYFTDLSAKKGIAVKVPKEFVHAKLYIGEAEALEGSANLTFSGMHKNIEQLRLVKSEEEIQALKAEFDRLWKKLEDAKAS
ncbi:MAG: phospholipase D-like domain-containing protein [Candidatus Micrarchaeia archaeon]